MIEHLRAAFHDVREFLLGEGRSRLGFVQQNLRGDVTKEFDYLAEGRIIEYFRREVAAPVRVLTEERGEVRTREGRTEWTLIVDPVDGSENFARGNEDVSVSLALLPGEEDPRPEEVTHALVASVFTGTVCEAVRGEGARRDGATVRPSEVTDLARAVVIVELNFRDRARLPEVYPLLAATRDLRRFGTAAGELAAVAYGGADAFVDTRDTLSPENWMAAQLIVREAGGVVTDRHGAPLAQVRSMTQGQSIVAAGNRALHAAIMGVLDRER